MRIYVAGAIGSNDCLKFLKNIREGMELGAYLIKMGHDPFIPHLDYQLSFFQDIKIEEYYRYSIAWLEFADCVLVIKGFENSFGTKKEIEKAKELGIPVYYNIEDIIIGNMTERKNNAKKT